MSFPIGSGAVPTAPVEEPSMHSAPIGRGAFPTTSFDLPPSYSSNPDPYRAPIHLSPIRIDACDLERNCYDRCYSESSCHSSENRHCHDTATGEHGSDNGCCELICVLIIFVGIGAVAAMALLGVFG